MTQEEAAKRLFEEAGFEKRTAAAYVRTNGNCEYCGTDLISNRLIYAGAQIDHLLPKSKHAPEIYEMAENYALSCTLCNGRKKDASVLEEGEDPKTILLTKRADLIGRAQLIIEKKRADEDKTWNLVKSIIQQIGSK